MEKIKKFLGFELPAFELKPEREEEIINSLVEAVRKSGMAIPISFFMAGLEPMSTIIGNMVIPFVPFMELLGIRGYDYTAFLMNHDNIKHINERLAKLREEREKKNFWGK
jgi:hypothetical protein